MKTHGAAWTGTVLLLAVAMAQAGRPLAVDDAEPVGTGEVELEAGVGYVADGNTHHGDFPVGLTIGVWPRLELGVGSGGQLEEREELAERHTASDWGDVTLGAKVKLLEAARWWADQAVAFTVKLPTASHHEGFGSGRVDYDLTWIVTRDVTDSINLHLNGGYTWVGDRARENYDDLCHYGLAADWHCRETVQLVAEVFAATPITEESRTGVQINGGVRWTVHPAVVLDAAAGAGLRHDAPDWTGTLGVTWTFGLFGKQEENGK